jgi:hypothetical protein
MKLTTPPRYITELLLYLLRLWKSLLRSAVVSRSEQLRSLLSSRDALSHTDESFRANNWKVTNRCTFTVMVTTTVKTRPSLAERARWDATLKVWPLVPQLAPGLLQLLHPCLKVIEVLAATLVFSPVLVFPELLVLDPA